jgi:hypothetical protein
MYSFLFCASVFLSTVRGEGVGVIGDWRLQKRELQVNQGQRDEEEKWRVTYEGRLEGQTREKKGRAGRFACAREEERVLIQTGGPIWDGGDHFESFFEPVETRSL